MSSSRGSSSTIAITFSPRVSWNFSATLFSTPRLILSDIVHRLSRAGLMALCQFLNGCRVQNLLGHAIDFLPDFAQSAAGGELTEIGIGQALHWRHIAFQRLHHLGHRNLSRWLRQHMAASGAAHAFDQSL